MKYTTKSSNVEEELKELADFHNKLTSYTDAKIIYVDSNHDRALDRFLDEANIKFDPENAIIYHELNAKRYRHFKEKGYMPNALELYMSEHTKGAIFPNATYSVKGIDVSMHGDIGINGSRGNIHSFNKLGEEAVIGHSHTPGISLGIWQVGTSSLLQLDYNKGPSSWLNTHCLIYKNGKRALINIVEGKWKL